MRYEEISLPLGENVLRIRFHAQLTVLAGLSGRERPAIIDAFANLTAGIVAGGGVALVDANGRRNIVGTLGTSDIPTNTSVGRPRELRSLLTVGAEDLGLPRPMDDPSRLALQSELSSARREAESVRRELAAAERRRVEHDRILEELAEAEATLARLGTDTDRRLQQRARMLVDLERTRVALEAVEAPPASRTRDTNLIAATVEIRRLADNWAKVSERIDQLSTRLADHPNLASDQLAKVVDIPDEIPEACAVAITEHQRLTVLCDTLRADLDRALNAPEVTVSNDSRVLILASLDQEQLWMTHRDAVLATEALQAAQRSVAQDAELDPERRDHLERAHHAVLEAEAHAEKRWLPGILIATVAACVAGLLAAADFEIMAVPVLLVVTVASVLAFVAKPRLALRRVRRTYQSALADVDAVDFADYSRRFNDDPDSEQWRRAEAVIADYESVMAVWRALVGDIDVTVAGDLELQVHEWVTHNDPARRDDTARTIRRSLERARTDLVEATRRLDAHLEPFGLTSTTRSVAATLQHRVRQGRIARTQVELVDSEETERKITRQLEVQLAGLGFESGTLATRIGAYGSELDAALQREDLRHTFAGQSELRARHDRLEAALAEERPDEALPTDESERPESPHVVELRARRDALRDRAASFDPPDTREATWRSTTLDTRIQNLQGALAAQADLLVDQPVDHLVETLVRYRPRWPTAQHEAAPAILDSPFGGTAPRLRDQLLDALLEAAQATQIILLTDDPAVTEWARSRAENGELTLVEPRPADATA